MKPGIVGSVVQGQEQVKVRQLLNTHPFCHCRSENTHTVFLTRFFRFMTCFPMMHFSDFIEMISAVIGCHGSRPLYVPQFGINSHSLQFPYSISFPLFHKLPFSIFPLKPPTFPFGPTQVHGSDSKERDKGIVPLQVFVCCVGGWGGGCYSSLWRTGGSSL